MENINLIDAALMSDKDSFMQAFNSAIANKVGDALEIKKIELASNLLQPGINVETLNEPEETQAEIGGTESVDSSTNAE